MVRLRLPARRQALLPTTLAAVAIFAAPSFAQDDEPSGTGADEDEPTPTADEGDDEEDATEPSPTPADEDEEEATPTPDEDEEEPTPTADEDEDESPSPTADETQDEDDEESPSPTPTPSDDDDDDDDDDDEATTTADESAETDFPTLTAGPIFATYPPAAVPPTVNAPFMQHSTAPEGTVFIAVGAILGAFGLGILLWRGIVACLLHRSVRRAAMEQHASGDTKAAFPAPPAQFYRYGDHNSTLSVGTAGGRGNRRTTRGPIPSATPSQTNLFFSPTAAPTGTPGGGPGTPGTGYFPSANSVYTPGGGNGGTASSRESRFLPSGFYAAGSSSPGNTVNNHTNSISMANLRPASSRGLSRNTMHEVTPPDSPQFTARREMSSSTLNLSAQNQQHSGHPGRAPSAYLEDLLDENPQAFPSAGGQMPSAHPHRSPGSRS